METLITIIGAVVAVALSYGITTNKVETLKEEITALKSEMKLLVRQDTCDRAHKYTDRDMTELKSDIKDIKAMLGKLTDRE